MHASLKTAEDELNLIKNQVQQTLLDIREHILDVTNPFNAIDDALTDEDEIEFDDLMGGGSGEGAGEVDAEGEGEEGLEGADGDAEPDDGAPEGYSKARPFYHSSKVLYLYPGTLRGILRSILPAARTSAAA